MERLGLGWLLGQSGWLSWLWWPLSLISWLWTAAKWFVLAVVLIVLFRVIINR